LGSLNHDELCAHRARIDSDAAILKSLGVISAVTFRHLFFYLDETAVFKKRFSLHKYRETWALHMNDAKSYRAKAVALLAAAEESPNHFLRPEYEYIASIYLRLAEQTLDATSMDDGNAGKRCIHY
jgi:hypothetical protein